MFKKLAGFAAVACLFTAGTAYADISDTAHNLSVLAGGQICVVCHAPHDTDITITDAPLWNHALTSSSLTFQPYTSTTLTATDVGQPGGISKLCLGCHDGQTAVDAFGGAPGTGPMVTGAVVGLDLRDDHPVSFVYDSQLATDDGGGLEDPSGAGTGYGGTGTIAGTMLFNGTLECGTCHDAHDTGVDPDGMFQRFDNANSQLCLTCHLK